MQPKWYFKSLDEGLTRKLGNGIATHIFFGKNVMLSLAEIAPGTISPVHSHPEEQWGYLLQGECVRIQDGEEVQMKIGDFWYTPSNVPHGVRVGASGALVMDIFSPPRDAYTRPGEGLAAKEYQSSSSPTSSGN
jgi:quercetin dioxygenase-like cupin family protein